MDATRASTFDAPAPNVTIELNNGLFRSRPVPEWGKLSGLAIKEQQQARKQEAVGPDERRGALRAALVQTQL